MGFLEREKSLLKKVQEANEGKLVRSRAEVLEAVSGHFEAILQYIASALEHSENEERQERYNNAVFSLDALNQMAVELGAEPLADIDTADKNAVDAFISETIQELYRKGISHN